MKDKIQVPLIIEAERDINWFVKVLPKFNGVTIFDQSVNCSIELDANHKGLGARWGAQIYAMGLPLGYLDLQIVHIELLNILVALRIWH